MFFKKGNKVMLGRKLYEETKQKLKLINMGKIISEETREKIRQKLLGHGVTVETREKMRLAKLGKKQSMEIIERKRIAFTGAKNPLWKNGVSTNGAGYVRILMPNHPRTSKKGYVSQHRLVMEKHIGRYLTEDEVVHHINNINNDNRIENLMLFKNQGKHVGYHIKQKIIHYFLSILIIDKLREVKQWETSALPTPCLTAR